MAAQQYYGQQPMQGGYYPPQPQGGYGGPPPPMMQPGYGAPPPMQPNMSPLEMRQQRAKEKHGCCGPCCAFCLGCLACCCLEDLAVSECLDCLF